MKNSSHTIKSFPKKFVTDRWLEEFKKTGKGWLRILSGSMSPLIQSGDQIFIKKVAPSKIYIGDIITFWKGNILVTHRVIRKVRKEEDIYFIERSDRYHQHSFVAPQSLMGKVWQVKKGAKSYNLNAIQWQLFNRITGITFLSAFAARIVGRKVPFFPKPLKSIIKIVYKTFGRISYKMLEISLLHKK